MNKIKNFFAKGKRKIGTSIALVMCIMSSMALTANAEADATVTAAFTTLGTDTKDTLAAVAVTGVTIMGVFLAWKYGRKIFNQVAK